MASSFITCPHMKLDESNTPRPLSGSLYIPLPCTPEINSGLILCSSCASAVRGAVLTEIIQEGISNSIQGYVKKKTFKNDAT